MISVILTFIIIYNTLCTKGGDTNLAHTSAFRLVVTLVANKPCYWLKRINENPIAGFCLLQV